MRLDESLSDTRKRCGILIPAYNSSLYLPELLLKISQVQPEISWQLEVLVVDDGSDVPLPIFHIPGLPFKLIRHGQNRGKGEALQTGFSYYLKKTEISSVITMDADLQHLPEYIPKFLERFCRDEDDLIVGCRTAVFKMMPFHRMISNKLTSLVISGMIGQWVPDSQCGFRLYSRKALERIQLKEQRFHLESEFLIRSGWAALQIGYVLIPTIYNDAPSAIRNIPDTLNFVWLILKMYKERIMGYV